MSLVNELNETAKTHLAEVRKHYNVNESGRITSPGKFEGEHFAAFVLWDMAMNGFADTDSTAEDDTPYFEFALSLDEMLDYGLVAEMDAEGNNLYYARLVESESGFVSMSIHDSPYEPDYDSAMLERTSVSVDWVPDEDADLSYLGEFSDIWENGAIENPNWTRGDHRVMRWFIPGITEQAHFDSLRETINPRNPAKRVYGVKTARKLARSYVQQDCERALSYGESWEMEGCIVTIEVDGIEMGSASLWGIESDSDDDYKRSTALELLSEARDSANAALDRLSDLELPSLEMLKTLID